MARPRIITLADGEVSLQGFPKEIADALSDHIKSFGAPAEVKLIDSPPDLLVDGTLTHKALGVHRQGNDNNIVIVAYNLETKQAAVETVSRAANYKDSVHQFKVTADRLKFV